MIPRPIVYAMVLVGVLALIPLVLVARARVSVSALPRIHLMPDMDNQAKYKAQAASSLFADGRAMRLPVEDTVARGELHEDDHFFRGKVDGTWAAGFPMPVARELMERGRQRYGIYCAPCHGLSGKGDGMVHRRALALQEGTWVPPSSLHDPTVRGRAVGHLFNTITHGIRNMPAYGAQIAVPDRWAIVAYVRALQRSQDARIEDVPDVLRSTVRPRAAAPAATSDSDAGEASAGESGSNGSKDQNAPPESGPPGEGGAADGTRGGEPEREGPPEASR